jgi:hypothetical protein
MVLPLGIVVALLRVLRHRLNFQEFDAASREHRRRGLIDGRADRIEIKPGIDVCRSLI